MMKKYVIDPQASLYKALLQMDQNGIKFLIAMDQDGPVVGTLTDGDIRRSLLHGMKLEEPVYLAICKNYVYVKQTDGLEEVLSAFQNKRIDFLPVVSDDCRLFNIITRRGLNALLLQNQKFKIDFDFETLDEMALEHAIYARPWGFYKTTILNDMFQSKIIHIMPKQALSLQSHERREEYWIIVSGVGLIQLGESIHPVSPGGSYFIPKGCKHRLTNTSESEVLVFNEVQLGDYFGEDDIKRYSDIYHRME